MLADGAASSLIAIGVALMATYLQIFPVRANLGMTITGGLLEPLPWGAAACYGHTGTTAAGKSMLIIAQE